jgi:hypothetical protein
MFDVDEENLVHVSRQIEAAMQYANKFDEDCAFQLGAFAVLLYTGAFVFVFS